MSTFNVFLKQFRVIEPYFSFREELKAVRFAPVAHYLVVFQVARIAVFKAFGKYVVELAAQREYHGDYWR